MTRYAEEPDKGGRQRASLALAERAPDLVKPAIAILAAVALLAGCGHSAPSRAMSAGTTAQSPSTWPTPPGSFPVPHLTWSIVAQFPALRCGDAIIRTPAFRTSGGVIRVTGRVEPWGASMEEMQIDLVPATSRTERDWVDYHSINLSQPSQGAFDFDSWTDKAVRPGRYRLAIYSQDADLAVLVFEGR